MDRTAIALLACFLLLGAFPLKAQQGSDKHTATASQDPFGQQEIHPHMLKLDLLQLVSWRRNGIIRGVIHLSYEHKIHPAWSINTEFASPYFFDRDGVTLLPLRDGMIGVGVGPRFYPGLAKIHAQGHWQNHLSADYFSLLLGTRLKQAPGGFSATDRLPTWFSDNFSLSLLYGVQRRIFHFWYVDFNFGIKSSYGDPDRNSGPMLQTRAGWQFFPVTSLRLGFAF